jgi:hypothetical protein
MNGFSVHPRYSLAMAQSLDRRNCQPGQPRPVTHNNHPSRAAAVSDFAAYASAGVAGRRLLSGQRGQGLDCFGEARQASGRGERGCGHGLLAGLDQAGGNLAAELIWLYCCC